MAIDNSHFELQESDIHDLDISDRVELQRLHDLYGKERVIGWLRAKVALPTRLELKRLEGRPVPEKQYYQLLAEYYVEGETQ